MRIAFKADVFQLEMGNVYGNLRLCMAVADRLRLKKNIDETMESYEKFIKRL